jgi:hypothetical protein
VNKYASALLIAAVCVLACRAESPPAAPHSTASAKNSTSNPVSDDAWSDIGVETVREPQRLLIRKIAWRGGPEALIIEGEEARRLHALLADNQRLEYACGYHWSLDFEYDVGVVTSIPINEHCESFRRSGEQIWQILRPYFSRAAASPSHYLLRIEAPPERKLSVERELERRLGLAFNVDPRGRTLLLAHAEPWSSEREVAVRAVSPYITMVQQIRSYDTGS